MTDIRQCWAYNRDGIRCEHPAGHPGKHVVTAEWGDDECFTPGTPKPPIAAPIPAAAPLVATSQPEKCIACQHAHKAGPCKCGCYEYIG